MKCMLAVVALVCISMMSCGEEKAAGPAKNRSEYKMLDVDGRVINIAESGVFLPGIYTDSGNSIKLSNYSIASETITIEKWEKFIEATHNTKWTWPDGFDIKTEIADQKKSPAFNMTWYEAIEYCNWLSSQEGLAPVYELIPAKNNEAGSGTTVVWHKQKDGYRLPTPEEWQNAVIGVRDGAENLKKKRQDEFNAAIASDGRLDASGRDRARVFAVDDIYENNIGLFVNLSQNVCEYTWGFAKAGEESIIRVWQEDSIDEKSIANCEVVEMLPRSLQTIFPDKRAYNATIRVARNRK